ncbi:MAG: GNAT family N-acetyltransferase [Bradyrhizobiaceae bacterium]|nr:GNAT family N-acetyltransferase [Bradyrhizobiaceae bacterium]
MMRPYPKEWERHDMLRDGTPVFVRPLKPEDADLYPDFLTEVTAEDLRLRFFVPVRELSPDLIFRLTHLDYEKAMAFIALEEKTGRMLGVVRLHHDPDRKAGEYAVLVRSHLKSHGLGWLLMHRMIEYAQAEGLERIHGQVLAENTTMLAMCGELGFTVTDDPLERGVKVVTLDLATDRASATQ